MFAGPPLLESSALFPWHVLMFLQMPGHFSNDKFHQTANPNSSKRISPLFPGIYSIQKMTDSIIFDVRGKNGCEFNFRFRFHSVSFFLFVCGLRCDARISWCGSPFELTFLPPPFNIRHSNLLSFRIKDTFVRAFSGSVYCLPFNKGFAITRLFSSIQWTLWTTQTLSVNLNWGCEVDEAVVRVPLIVVIQRERERVWERILQLKLFLTNILQISIYLVTISGIR